MTKDISRQYGNDTDDDGNIPINLNERLGDSTDFDLRGQLVDLKISNRNGKKIVSIPTVDYVGNLQKAIELLISDTKKLNHRLVRAEQVIKSQDSQISKQDALLKKQDQLIKTMTQSLAKKMDKF